MMEDLELRDVWREKNLMEKEYTFFSNRHQSLSRIDFILMTNDLFSRVKKSMIHPRTLSDHNPVWMEIYTGDRIRKSWRLNDNLFRYEENVKECQKYMKEFFELNMNKGTPMEIIWDASKAYMRGVLIELNAKQRRKREEKRRLLEQEIKKKEKILINNPSDQKVKEAVKVLKAQFGMLIADQVATNLQYAKHNTFCNANKPGRWLAYQLRKKQKSRMVEKIIYNGKEVSQQIEIKKAFLEYYKNLYIKEDINEGNIDKYLQDQLEYIISKDQQERLDKLITNDEIILAIKQLKVGKTPGTDGLTAVYYKNLQLEIINPLRYLFNEIQKGGQVPPSWKTAFISLIPKEGQDLTQTKNYRPISLLNTDYKIFAKILANRLMPVMQEKIHSDQTGFLQGRYMKNNVRHIINLLEHLKKYNQKEAAFIFLDAEKAFDRLSWQFLIKLLEKMQFGTYFKQSIYAIYQNQKAQLIINGDVTENFNIEKGTRQGCPLSPLLFVLTLEVLLNKIRAEGQIEGIRIRTYEYKLRAFADDLVVTLAKPLQSVRVLMDKVLQYGQISGFKVNINKTKILSKNMIIKHQEELVKITGFELVKKVKYLGVYISSSNMKLYKNNYEVLWQKVQSDLQTWSKLQLSLLGRIAVVKMNVLPKFLFLFQMLPIFKTDKNLKEWQKGINKYIWLGKRPRVKQKIMQDTRERGGLRMPNLRLYYEAATLTMISDWINMTDDQVLNIEGYDLLYGWHAYLVYEKKPDTIFKDHILRNGLLRIWKKYQYMLNGQIPLWSIPRHMMENISVQQRMDLIRYEELLIMQKGTLVLKSMKDLKEEGIIQTWFNYGQLQARWKEDQKKGLLQRDEGLIKEIKKQGPMHLKRIYSLLLEIDSETELVKDCMIKWAQNFGTTVMMDTWEKIWVRNVKFTQAQNLRENFYKMFYRWHLDPKKLACMYPDMQPKCWRCGSEDATYYHIWWTCKKIKSFWIKIWWILQNVVKKKINFEPQFFLLGIINDVNLTETTLILNLITAARLLVAQYWKSEDIPSVQEWTLKVMHLAEMAKISSYLKDHSNERYVRDWKKWIDYTKRKYQANNIQVLYE